MDEPLVASIIQARIGSTRLPGKVLMPLVGKPVLWHVIHRLRKCRMVNRIAIATSDRPLDDPLVEFAREQRVELVRGSEDNVLQRFALAARQIGPDVIVRVTGDAPLIDPHTLDLFVERLISEHADYCTSDPGPPHTINEGFCAFTRSAMERLLQEAPDDPTAREHITAYFKEHPASYRIVHQPIDPAHVFEGARLSVDTPADFRFMEEIYRRLHAAPGEAVVADVVSLLQSHPELLRINCHVHQKKAHEKTRRILVRCDGDERIGLGHVVRSIALADDLRERHGFGVAFAMASGKIGRETVEQAGFPVEMKPDHDDEAAWIERMAANRQMDGLILDVRTSLSPAVLCKCRNRGILIATIDDTSERRREADLAFFPPIPQLEHMDWGEFKGKLYAGREYVLLRPSFACPAPDPGNSLPRILVSMGGSDPEGLVFRVVDALETLREDFQPVLVIGRAFRQRQALAERVAHASRAYDIRENVTDMASLMAEADLAVASFGMTVYELAATGVPTIVICLTDDHALSARTLSDAGSILNLGVHARLQPAEIALAIAQLLGNPAQRRAMRELAKSDRFEEGCQRVGEEIARALESRP
jgi:spore coat polysaccharide biosynthesis protein SpsF